MKRLTLEIDLSENEIFDEEVTKAVRAKKCCVFRYRTGREGFGH